MTQVRVWGFVRSDWLIHAPITVARESFHAKPIVHKVLSDMYSRVTLIIPSLIRPTTCTLIIPTTLIIPYFDWSKFKCSHRVNSLSGVLTLIIPYFTPYTGGVLWGLPDCTRKRSPRTNQKPTSNIVETLLLPIRLRRNNEISFCLSKRSIPPSTCTAIPNGFITWTFPAPCSYPSHWFNN